MTTAVGFTLFETAIGQCGIAWNAHGIVGSQLPEASDVLAVAQMLRRFPAARRQTPPPAIQRVIDDIGALLSGEFIDLRGAELDMQGVPAFNRRVYEVARTIRCGATMTYGEIALELGDRTAARAVGQALGENPFPIIVPCHRVLAANGKSGGFSARGGVRTKLRMLTIEGAHPQDPPTLFDAYCGGATTTH